MDYLESTRIVDFNQQTLAEPYTLDWHTKLRHTLDSKWDYPVNYTLCFCPGPWFSSPFLHQSVFLETGTTGQLRLDFWRLFQPGLRVIHWNKQQLLRWKFCYWVEIFTHIPGTSYSQEQIKQRVGLCNCNSTAWSTSKLSAHCQPVTKVHN